MSSARYDNNCYQIGSHVTSTGQAFSPIKVSQLVRHNHYPRLDPAPEIIHCAFPYECFSSIAPPDTNRAISRYHSSIVTHLRDYSFHWFSLALHQMLAAASNCSPTYTSSLRALFSTAPWSQCRGSVKLSVLLRLFTTFFSLVLNPVISAAFGYPLITPVGCPGPIRTSCSSLHTGARTKEATIRLKTAVYLYSFAIGGRTNLHCSFVTFNSF